MYYYCEACESRIKFPTETGKPVCPTCGNDLITIGEGGDLGSLMNGVMSLAVRAIKGVETLNKTLEDLSGKLDQIRGEMRENNKVEHRKIAYNMALDNARAAIKDIVHKKIMEGGEDE
jgi:hypothetical protein